ncbi:hypothetical protein CspHIS471_0401550 [Cutaneotrichosporon sp. HIS471]|nr:hypothetical protein CspHIS471_0401550 [Cutaneotrichosporon sp. HIS471]
MPAVNSGLVLVTGASGFLGTYVVKELLQRGYDVRAVVRDTVKGEYVQNKFPGAKYAIVKDMAEPGAYNQVIKGIDAVVHVASPLDFDNTGGPEAVIGPAVFGVENLLKAASDTALGGNVKCFVQISSVAAVAGLPDGNPKTLTEEQWNDADLNKTYELGAAAPGALKYVASKVEAERAFWKWFEEKRAFDGVAILPGMILGTPMEYSPSGELGLTNGWVAAFAGPDNFGIDFEFWSPVGINDVAFATVSALSKPEAGGERYLVAGPPLFGNDVAILAEEYFPSAPTKPNMDPAFRDAQKAKASKFDGSKVEKAFGFKYRPTEDVIRELFNLVKERQVA